MGYVSSKYKNPGNEVLIEIRNKKLRARIVKMPIINKKFSE
jgi:glycine cleavage system aminomethyltransferase T